MAWLETPSALQYTPQLEPLWRRRQAQTQRSQVPVVETWGHRMRGCGLPSAARHYTQESDSSSTWTRLALFHLTHGQPRSRYDYSGPSHRQTEATAYRQQTQGGSVGNTLPSLPSSGCSKGSSHGRVD